MNSKTVLSFNYVKFRNASNPPSSNILDSKTFLDVLPPEVRHHIFSHIFASSTGSIILSLPSRDRGVYRNTDSWRTEELLDPKATTSLQIIPYDPVYRWVIIDEPMNLSLLRVCKQTYIECKSLIWRCNTLHIESPDDIDLFERCKGKNVLLQHNSFYTGSPDGFGVFDRYNGVLHGHLPTQLHMHVRSLSIDTHLFEKAPENWGKIFRRLGRWPSLRNLTLLGPVSSWDGGRKNIYFEYKLWEWQDKSVNAISWLVCLLHSIHDSIPTHVKKKIFLKIGPFQIRDNVLYQSRALREKREWLARFSPYGPRQFIENLNAVLGGELWVDGILCWKDKVEVCDIFNFTPEDAKELNRMENWEKPKAGAEETPSTNKT